MSSDAVDTAVPCKDSDLEKKDSLLIATDVCIECLRKPQWRCNQGMQKHSSLNLFDSTEKHIKRKLSGQNYDSTIAPFAITFRGKSSSLAWLIVVG